MKRFVATHDGCLIAEVEVAYEDDEYFYVVGSNRPTPKNGKYFQYFKNYSAAKLWLIRRNKKEIEEVEARLRELDDERDWIRRLKPGFSIPFSYGMAI